jgi:hypothetical protein
MLAGPFYAQGPGRVRCGPGAAGELLVRYNNECGAWAS